MKSLHQLVVEGLKKGDQIRHERGSRYTYSHYRAPRPQGRVDRLAIMDPGKHIGIDADGNPTGLTEGAYWTAEAGQ